MTLSATRSRPCIRFSYSLRTLWLLVTALAIWLGYEVNWIRQRRMFIALNPTVEVFFDAESDGKGGLIHRRAPDCLWLFGEQGAALIDIPIPEEEVRVDADGQRVARPSHPTIVRAGRLFPEADLYASTMDRYEQLPICDRILKPR